MPRHALLDNVTHKDLRVAMRFGAQYGDAIGMVAVFPTEFAELQREYPIFLRRDAAGAWQAVALLGFSADENLFLQGDQWSASYLPGVIAKGPFLIGHQEQHVDGQLSRVPVIHVDMEHPRLGDVEGERIFLPHGGHTPYLEHVITILRGINDGVAAAHAMFPALDAAGLLQPMRLEFALDDAHAVNVDGLYAIDRERLAALAPDVLVGLHRSGCLEGAYLMLSSLHNLRRLMAEKQRRLRAASGPEGSHHAAGQAA